MKATNLPIPGHSLLYDGAIHVRDGAIDGGCQCGALPDGVPVKIPSQRTTREWHRTHKNDVRRGELEPEPEPEPEKPAPPRHTHLDRMVRTEGECPGCDMIWAAQRQRLEKKSTVRVAEAQIDAMTRETMARDKVGNLNAGTS
jgi:hypothetical protein